MSEIKSIIKIKSAIRSSFANNKYATVLNNGDQNNGIILLKLLRKDNKSRLLGRSINQHGKEIETEEYWNPLEREPLRLVNKEHLRF